MLLSLYSYPVPLEDAYDMCEEFLDIKHEDAKELIDSFVNEKEPFSTTIKGEKSYFPPGLLICDETETTAPTRGYKPEDFIYTPPVDLKSERLMVAPAGLVWIVTDKCMTDCVYCYADKRHSPQLMSLEIVEKFLADANSSKIGEIFLSGGEFFLHPHWKEILHLLDRYGYTPQMISTKIPVNKDIVETLKSYPPILIQISLDSLDSGILQKTLRVKDDYRDRMLSCLTLLDKAGIPLQVATVLTKESAAEENLDDILGFLKGLKNLRRWTIRICFPSLYSKTDYSVWKVDNPFREILRQWVDRNSKDIGFQISTDEGNRQFYSSTKTGSMDFPGARCSANYSHMVILPDGKVTLCEQLYWNPRFLIGDVHRNTLAEIWQGDRAIHLANIPQKEINPDSACAKCDIYEKCLSYPNKCYVDVLKAYGADKWDYPDLRCSFAPPFIKEL